jgi:hypothetical protein
MIFLDRISGRSARFIGANRILPCVLSMGLSVCSWAGEDLEPPRLGSDSDVPSGTGPTPAPRATIPGRGTASPASVDRFSSARGDVRYEGVPVSGSRITIGVSGTLDPRTSYHWVQIEGPPVTIEDETKPRITVTVPPDAQALGFLMTMNDARGQRTARISIPIRSAENPASPSVLRADAGDDQIGLVGRRITLNGSGGSSVAGIAYRWFQMAGPRVDHGLQEASYYSFTPTAPGIYRFGLVVATARPDSPNGLAISDVDEVVVSVGNPPSGLAGNPSGGAASVTWTAALDQWLQGSGGVSARATLQRAAEVLDTISWRTSLYTNFAELSSEMMRRFDAVIPKDPIERQSWTMAVFAPLTQHVASEMLGAGLDLRMPQGQYQGLTPAQQERLRQLFATYAAEFRSRAQAH